MPMTISYRPGRLGAAVVAMLASAVCLAAEPAPDTAQALAQAHFFAGLSASERAELAMAATARRGEQGERIIEQDKPLTRMYVVLDGRAEVRVGNTPVAILPAQSLVGEVEFLDGLPASADVVLLEASRLIELDNLALTRLMKRRTRLGYVLMTGIARLEAQRLRSMDQRQGK